MYDEPSTRKTWSPSLGARTAVADGAGLVFGAGMMDPMWSVRRVLATVGVSRCGSRISLFVCPRASTTVCGPWTRMLGVLVAEQCHNVPSPLVGEGTVWRAPSQLTQ